MYVTGAENSLDLNHLSNQYPSSYSSSLSILIRPQNNVFGFCLSNDCELRLVIITSADKNQINIFCFIIDGNLSIQISFTRRDWVYSRV